MSEGKIKENMGNLILYGSNLLGLLRKKGTIP